MKLKFWESGEKDKKSPPDSQENDTLPKTYTVTVFCGQLRSGNCVHVTAVSRFSRSELASVLDKAIRPLIGDKPPASWDSELRAKLGEIQAGLQRDQPAALITIQSFTVELPTKLG